MVVIQLCPEECITLRRALRSDFLLHLIAIHSMLMSHEGVFVRAFHAIVQHAIAHGLVIRMNTRWTEFL